MCNLPTLVFVPGSWHLPSCYDKVTKVLQEKHNLKCTSFNLPSTNGDPAATFKDDVDAARKTIAKEIDQGRNVVVIAHSYGGMVGNSAIKGFAKTRVTDGASSTDSGNAELSPKGHVIGLILIASGFTLTGVAFMDPFFGHPPPAWRVNKETGFADIVISPRQFFYHDLSEEESEYWASRLTTQSLKSLFEGGEYAYGGWQDVPTWYIGTIEDQGLPVLVQRMQVGMAREMGGSVVHRELRTSHSPFLSQPDATADIIVEAVEAFTGKSVRNNAMISTQSKNLAIPEARLLQPLTWFKFGLPKMFGRFLGRSILTFNWFRRLFSSA